VSRVGTDQRIAVGLHTPSEPNPAMADVPEARGVSPLSHRSVRAV